jgi:BON domain
MKKMVIGLLVIVAMPLSLSAYCAKCQQGPRTYNSYGRQQQYSKNVGYDATRHQNSNDYFTTKDDQRIAEEIRNRLADGDLENPNDIQVFVEYGKVILEGKVNDPDSRQSAEDTASEVPGVRTVVNGIYVDNRQSIQKQQQGRQNGQQRQDQENAK